MKTIKIILTLTAIVLTACDNSPPADTGATDETEHTEAKADAGIEIPKAVRDNLGITFAAVERRAVRRTVRVPGTFELRPEARREYHAMLPGRVDLKVNQYDRVKAGDLIATIDSPQWARMRHAVVEAEGEIRLAEAAIRVAEAKLTELAQRIVFTDRRIAQLKDAGSRNVSLEATADEQRNSRPRLEAELNARRVDLDEANEHFDSQLTVMASLTGMTVDRLTSKTNGDEPVWRTKLSVEIHAEAAGIVDTVHVTPGGWAQTGEPMLATTDASMMRFHAHAPQSDIAKFATGQDGRIVPPDGGSLADAEPIDGSITVGFKGHADERTVPIYLQNKQWPAWAKPGIGAYLEVVTDGDSEPEPSIPVRALVNDDLRVLFFRRDPENPDRALAVEADLGVSDGRWVEVLSGITDGDEVVVDGAYALKLASSDRPAAPEGYHYHADGSLHKNH